MSENSIFKNGVRIIRSTLKLTGDVKMEDREIRLENIKRRRNERKIKRRKAFLKKLCVFFMLAAVVTMVVLSLTVFFPINNIVVRNPEPYEPSELVQKSGIKMGQNLWLAGGQAEKNITKALPYISELKISRKLPGTIIITAEKAIAKYCFETTDGLYLCDLENKLLEKATSIPKGVIFIKGCTIKKTAPGNNVIIEDEQNQKLVEELLGALNQKNIVPDEIDVKDSVAISFKIDGRFTVNLGSSAYLEGKLAHLKSMLEKIEDNRFGVINLSYWTPENLQGIFTQTGVE